MNGLLTKVMEQDVFKPASPEDQKKRKEEKYGPPFHCPHCKEKLDSVNTISNLYQEAYLKGNTITDWGDQDSGEVHTVTCPECGENIDVGLLNFA